MSKKVLYVEGNKSIWGVLRGKEVFSSFASTWNATDTFEVVYTSPSTIEQVNVDSFDVIWLDNTQELGALKSLSKYVGKKRIVYALDEFVFEGIGGRAAKVGDVRVIQLLIGISDAIVVANPTISAIMVQLGVIDESKEVHVVSSAISPKFYPVYKNFSKTFDAMRRPKASVMVKGSILPQNVLSFIKAYNREYDITISSIGEVGEDVLELITSGKVSHIRHWTNPDVSSKNYQQHFAIERDKSYDFTILCKPESLHGELYELCTYDEDVLTSIASGSIPVAGYNHVGYEDNASVFASGLRFGPQSSPKEIYDMISKTWFDGSRWTQVYALSTKLVASRLDTSPQVLAEYYRAVVGNIEADEKLGKLSEMVSQVVSTNESKDNVVEVDFGQK